jgi:peptide deformylase
VGIVNASVRNLSKTATLKLIRPAAGGIFTDGMAARPILRFPDSRLRQTSVEVKNVDDDVRRLVADMADSMYAANGAGLAAIQVGSPLRIFIVDGGVAGGSEQDPPKVFINPKILEISDEAQTGDEGCLSFPGIFVAVKRGMRARVSATDLDGNAFEVEGEALYARALQHETDHLNGRLLIDQVGPVKREIIKRKLRKDAEAAAAEEAQEDDASSAG